MEGTKNKMADTLSQYYLHKEVNTPHPLYNLVTADVQLDPECNLLGEQQVAELCATRIADRREECKVEATELMRQL